MIFLFSDSRLTKYEAFLTDSPHFKWNKALPHLGIATQIFTSIFVIVTSISIKIYFKIKTNKPGKLVIKNTITFKRLNYSYGLALLLSAVIQTIFMKNESTDTYMLHFTLSLGLNSMLLSFLIRDKEAIEYFKRKFQQFKERNGVNFQKLRIFKLYYRVGVGPIRGLEVIDAPDCVVVPPDDVAAPNEEISI